MIDAPNSHYQVVTFVLSDGRRVAYTGRAQMDHTNPPRVVDIIISRSEPLPNGMTWDTMPGEQIVKVVS